MFGFIKKLFFKESIEDFEKRANDLVIGRNNGKLHVEKLSNEQISRLAYTFSNRLVFRIQGYIEYLGDVISREALVSWENCIDNYDEVDVCIVAEKHTQIEELKEIEAEWIKKGILYCLEDVEQTPYIKDLTEYKESFILIDNTYRFIQVSENNKVQFSGWTPFSTFEVLTLVQRLQMKFRGLYNHCEVESDADRLILDRIGRT